eukprot:236829-Chlamydomonas_euryale.AAC.1
MVARLMGGAAAAPLVFEAFSVFRTLHRPLPVALTPALLAWGSGMEDGPRELLRSRLPYLLACE